MASNAHCPKSLLLLGTSACFTAKNLRQASQKLNHMALNIGRLNWDDLKLFLALAGNGSVRGTAREMRLSINTVRARLDLLEHLTGEPLVERSAKGLSLTEAGRQLRETAERMRAAAETSPITAAEPAADVPSDAIRLSLTEGLAAYWLMPKIAEFQKENPDILVRLRTDARAADQSLADADLAVQLRAPDDSAFEVEEIGTLHLMPFASPAYLAERGTPKHFEEWRTHRLVWQDWEPEAKDIMPLFIADDAPSRIISLITGSTSAQLAAIRAGVGLGFLPTYIARVVPGVCPVDFGMQFRRTIYLIARSARRSRHADELACKLKDAFQDRSLFGELFQVPG